MNKKILFLTQNSYGTYSYEFTGTKQKGRLWMTAVKERRKRDKEK